MQLDKVEMALPCDEVDHLRCLINEYAHFLDMWHGLDNSGGLLRLDEAMAPSPEDEADEIRARTFRCTSRPDRLHTTQFRLEHHSIPHDPLSTSKSTCKKINQKAPPSALLSGAKILRGTTRFKWYSHSSFPVREILPIP